MPNRNPEFDDAVQTESRQKLKKPPLYKVLLHNDNYTTMEFVVWVLQTIFHHNEADAFRIMLQVHVQGIGIAGIYPYEVAEMKVSQVSAAARKFEYPLLCTMDEEG